MCGDGTNMCDDDGDRADDVENIDDDDDADVVYVGIVNMCIYLLC